MSGGVWAVVREDACEVAVFRDETSALRFVVRSVEAHDVRSVAVFVPWGVPIMAYLDDSAKFADAVAADAEDGVCQHERTRELAVMGAAPQIMCLACGVIVGGG